MFGHQKPNDFIRPLTVDEKVSKQKPKYRNSDVNLIWKMAYKNYVTLNLYLINN